LHGLSDLCHLKSDDMTSPNHRIDDVGLAMARGLALSLGHPDIDNSELKLDARPAFTR